MRLQQTNHVFAHLMSVCVFRVSEITVYFSAKKSDVDFGFIVVNIWCSFFLFLECQVLKMF